MRKSIDRTEQVYSRISSELLERLEVLAAKRRKKRPEAIEEAIEHWVATGESPQVSPNGIVPVQDKNVRNSIDSRGSELEYGSDAEATFRTLSPTEHLCIERLLCILRSPKPGLPDAIISNLIQFQEFAVLYERYSDQASGHAPGESRGIGERDGEVDKALRDARALGKRVEELGKAGGGEHSRETRDSKPPRKRGRA